MGTDESTANSASPTVLDGGILTLKGNVADSKIIVDGAGTVKLKLEGYNTSLAAGKWLDLKQASDNVELEVVGVNKVVNAGIVGATNSNNIAVKGTGSLELPNATVTATKLTVENGIFTTGTVTGNVDVTGGVAITGAITGDLTVNGDAVASYTSATGTTTETKGVVYKANVGTVYGDPDIKVPENLKNLPLGVKVTSADTVKVEEVEYTGNDAVITPTVKVKRKVFGDAEKTLENKKDYTVSFKSSVADKKGIGEKEVEFLPVAGTGNVFDSALNVKVKVNPRNISNAIVKLKAPVKPYSGDNQTVEIEEVKVGDITLSASDYDLSEQTQKDAGKYKVKITAKNNFTGSVEQNWEITKVSITPTVTIANKAYDGNVSVDNSQINVAFAGTKGTDGTGLTIGTDYTVDAKYDKLNVGDREVNGTITLTKTGKLKNYNLIRNTFSVKSKITKAAAPAAPTGLAGTIAVSKYDSDKFSYTLSHDKIDGYKYEYKKGADGKWQSSPVFDLIAPGTTSIDFYARVAGSDNTEAGTDTHTASGVFNKINNPKLPVLTYKISEGKSGKKVVEITKQEGAEYTFDDGAHWVKENIQEITPASNSKIGIRFKETATLKEAKVIEEVDTTKTTLSLPAPLLNGKQEVGSAPDKFKYTIAVPATTLPAGATYQYKKDSETWVNVNAFDSLEVGSKHVFYIRIVDANGNPSVATSKEVTFDKIKVAAPALVYNITAGTNKGKKVTIKTQTVDGVAGNVTYGFGKIWGSSNVADNVTDSTLRIGIRFTPTDSTRYDVVERTSMITVNGTKGVVNNGDVVVKPEEPKKDEPKKDNTKKPDETKKPDDTKKPDNNTTKPANVDKAIKDAFKKSTKSGSVSLTGIGSALKKAVGENAASLSVNLKTSKTKATAASVTKKLKGSKLVSKTVYSLNVKSGATNLTDKQVSGSKIKVTLKVSLGNKNRTVYVMDVSTGKRVKAKYNAKTKKITFTTANVGDFVIVNKAK